MRAKYQTFGNDLMDLLESITAVEIKEAIGDSTVNHRTPTVKQVIRFLTRKGAKRSHKTLGTNLSAIYELFVSYGVTFGNREVNLRTDAVDINEFLITFADVVVSEKDIRKEIGKSLAA